MRWPLWLPVVFLFLSSPARALDDAWASAAFDAARATLKESPLPPRAPSPVDESDELRTSVLSVLERNPVTAELAAPMIRAQGITFSIRAESEDKSLTGAWATYKRDLRLVVLNRDAINEDKPCEPLIAGKPLTPSQLSALARRYLPVFAHELGGHARHYAELRALLGGPAPNVRETEIDAFRVEAMAVAAERKTDSDYLRDGRAYAAGESALVDKYWEAKERRDPSLFSDYVTKPASYAKLPLAAAGPVADYYKNDAGRLDALDKLLIGDDPPADEAGLGRRQLPDGPGFRGR